MRKSISCMFGAALALIAVPAAAQDYPDGPVTIVVGYAPGGSADASARFVAQKMEQVLGTPFVVENKTGASGLVGAATVAQSDPDGQTLMYANQGVMVIGPIFNPDTPVNPVGDLVGVGTTGAKPVVLVVDPELPINSVQELIDYAKQHPGQLSYGSGGLGTSPHLAGAIFANMAGIDMQHVTYGGENPAVLDVIGHRLQVVFASVGATMPHVETGELRALAVTSDVRIKDLPDLPTVAESGIDGYRVESWSGLVAPAGTSQEVRNTLNEALAEVVAMPETQEFFQAEGIVPFTMTPEEFQAFIEQEAPKWRDALTDVVQTN